MSEVLGLVSLGATAAGLWYLNTKLNQKSTLGGYNYIITKDNTGIKSINGTTGLVDYSGPDASTVIQSSVNALANGGLIFIKQGTYNLTSPIDISNRTISIVGEHRFNTILSSSGDVIRILNLAGTVGLTAQQSVNNITLDGVNKSGAGLNLSRIFRCNFDNLYLKNCNYGIRLDQTITNTFTNPYISSCNTGIIFDTDITTTTNFNNGNVIVGGEINNGNPGVLIYGTAAGNKFYGTTIEGGNVTQAIIKTAYLTVNSQDTVPNSNIFDGCWFETAGVTTPVHVDIQKDGLSTFYPWSNVVSNSYFASDGSYTAINNPGARNIFSGNYMSGSAGQTAAITVSGNDNIVAFNSVAFNTLVISNIGSRNLLKTNYGYTTFLTVLSPTFAIDSAGPKAVSIAHGLSLTPNAQDCSLTAISTATDWIGQIVITSITATNINVTVNVTAPSITPGATARLSLRVGKP